MPIDQMRMADRADAYSAANSRTCASVSPHAASNPSMGCASSDWTSSSQPSVREAMNASSTSPRSIRTLSTALPNAASPPGRTGT
jgi:hypothetical protein